jgi:hypothetical protein
MRCAGRTREDKPCNFPGRYAHPADPGALLCTAHAAASGDELAKAEQRSRLDGYQAKKAKKARVKRSKDPLTAQAARVAELEELAARAAKKGELATAARFSELAAQLLMPSVRAQAEAGALTPEPTRSTVPPLRVPLGGLSDEELNCLRIGMAAVEREIVKAQERDTGTAVPVGARPLSLTGPGAGLLASVFGDEDPR